MKLFLSCALPVALCALAGVQLSANGAPKKPASTRNMKPAAKTVSTALRPLAKYEPARGVYLGAALDLSTITGGDRVAQIADKMRDWDKEAGKNHAIFLSFIQFPHADGSMPTFDSDPQGWISSRDFSDAASTRGATPMITLEPMLPFDFARAWKPGEKLYEATKLYAQGAGAWGKPLFIRFAHEMNGSWYPWAEWEDKNRNQKRDYATEDTGFTADLYKQAYRNVAAMFRRYAPNVALVWCPNSGLLGGPRGDVFTPWYPGDDVVDWVGLDTYERGWAMPMPGAKLWGGQFAQTITHDDADDPKTPWNESVDFYQTFAVKKRKPMMICETGATLSFRNDLPLDQRAALTTDWKSGYWDKNEYGWMQGVYGTSYYKKQPLLKTLDADFPMIKAIVWFQIAKHEWIPVKQSSGKIRFYDDTWADYRIGGGAQESAAPDSAPQELSLYRDLISNPYFLSSVRR